MDLSNDLISKFVKITGGETTKKSKEGTVYGTITEFENKLYVKIDGSDLLTPINSTSDVKDGERVTVMIKDHNAIVTGNITSPSASSGDVKKVTQNVEELGGEIAKFETVIADKIGVAELDAEVARINELIAGKANVEDLSATNAEIVNLQAKDAEIINLVAGKAEIDDLTAANAEIENLKAKDAEISNLVAGKANITDLDVINADIVNLKAKDIETDTLIADKASIGDLNAVKADINELEAGKADVDVLNAAVANIETLTSDLAIMDQAIAGKANIGDLNATNARIDNLQSTKADIDHLNANFATIEQLNTTNANVGTLDAEVADIQTLVNGNLTSDNIASLNLTSANTTIQNAMIKDAMIDSVTASKLTAGEIDTNEITIKSTDGSMILTGSVQQFKDENGTIRIQIGKDGEGNFTFVLYDETGNGVLIDESGIKSSNAIADGLIVDAKVADNANIAGSKLDIASVVTEVNNGTTTIKSNKIYLDGENQTLDVAFNQMQTNVDANSESIQTNTTALSVQNGQINTLISENQSRQTEIANLSNNLTGSTTEINNKYSALEQDLNSFKTTVGESYTTKAEFNGLQIGGTNLLPETDIRKYGLGYWMGNDGNSVYVDGSDDSGYPTIRIIGTTGACYRDYIALKRNTVYTYSMQMICDKDITCDTNGPLHMHLVADRFNPAEFHEEIYLSRPSGMLEASKWHKVSVTFRTPDNQETYYMKPFIYQIPGDCYFYFMKPQVEEGSRATDWSPAPSDIDNRLDATNDNLQNNYSTTSAMNSAIQQKANEINQTVSQTYTSKTEFNNLQIGGTNTFSLNAIGIDTSEINYWTTVNLVTDKQNRGFRVESADGRMHIRLFRVLDSDGYWTISFKYKSSVTIGPIIVDVADLGRIEITSETHYKTLTNTVLVSNYGDGGTYNFVDIEQHVDVGQSVTYEFYDIKVEKGNKATAWSPCPKDTQGDIDGVANNLAANYSTTSAMNSAINQKANEITQTVSQNYATKQSVTDVSNNLTINYSTTEAMNSAINQKANEITQTVSQTYTTKTEFDNMEIGGTNLVHNGNFKGVAAGRAIPKWTFWGNDIHIYHAQGAPGYNYPGCVYIGSNLTDGSRAGIYSNRIHISKVEKGATYMASFILTMESSVKSAVAYIEYLNADVNQIVHSQVLTTGRYATDIVNGLNDHYYHIPFTMWDGDFSYVQITFNHGGTNIVGSGYLMIVGNVQIEKGNKATNWSPAPEDIQEQIDDTNNNLVNNYSTTAAMNSAITQKANEITQTVSETYTTKVEFDNLEIGGTNLFRNSNFVKVPALNAAHDAAYVVTTSVDNGRMTPKYGGQILFVDNSPAASTTVDVDTYVTVGDNIYLEPYTEYTLSYDYMSLTEGAITDMSGCVYLWNYEGAGSVQLPIMIGPGDLTGGVRKRFVGTFTTTDFTVCQVRVGFHAVGYAWFAYEGFKLEKGNKATAWSPAPEDIQGQIDDTNANLANNYSTTASMNSAIEQKSNQILSTVSSTYATNTTVNNAVQLAKSMGEGLMLNTDATFRTGYNSIEVYNNNLNDTVTINRIASPTGCPTTSGYCLEVKSIGNATPGYGGIYFATYSRASAIFITKIIAKIPEGAFINFASNDIGWAAGDADQRWLTPNRGTGKWEEYIYYVKCGSSGNFGTTNFYYISDVPYTVSAENPLIWHVAYGTVFDITDTDERITNLTNDLANNYSTTSQMNTAIEQKSNQILSTVSQTYTTKYEAKTATDGTTGLNRYLFERYRANGTEPTNPTIADLNGKELIYSELVTDAPVHTGDYGDNYIGVLTFYLYYEYDFTYTVSITTDDGGTVYLNDTMIAQTTSCIQHNVIFDMRRGLNKVMIIYLEGSGLDGVSWGGIPDWKYFGAYATTVMAKVNADFTTNSHMNSAINQKADEITQSVSSTYTTKAEFDNLEVGGANIIFNGGFARGLEGWYSNGGSHSAQPCADAPSGHMFASYVNNYGQGIYTIINFPDHTYVNENGDYIVTFYAKADTTKEIYTSMEGDPATITYFTLNTSWQKCVYKFRRRNTGSSALVFYSANTVAANIYIHSIMVERGTVASAWKPHPKETQDQIDATNANLANNYSTTSQMNAAINLKANEITQSVSDTYATKTELANLPVSGSVNLLRRSSDFGDPTIWRQERADLTTLKYRGCRIYQTPYDWADYGYVVNDLMSRGVIEANVNYTFSCYIRSTSASYTPTIGFYGHADYHSGNGTNCGTATTSWQRISVTFYWWNLAAADYPIRFEAWTPSTDGSFIQVAGMKLEKGDRATDWTPSPEDGTEAENRWLFEMYYSELGTTSSTTAYPTFKDILPGAFVSSQLVENLTYLGDYGSSYLGKLTASFYFEADSTQTKTVFTDDNSTWYLNGATIGQAYTCTATSITFNFKKGWNKLTVLWLEGGGGDGVTIEGGITGYSRMNAYNVGNIDETGIYLNYEITNSYATKSEVNQTSTDLTIKFTESGGYNLLRNGHANKGTSYWVDNGGGISVSGGAGGGVHGNYFVTTMPGGIHYYDWVRLHPNTHYVYQAKIWTQTPFGGSNVVPLHWWFSTNAVDINDVGVTWVDWSANVDHAQTWTQCYVHFVTPDRDVYMRPFFYGVTAEPFYVSEIMLSESRVVQRWSPHPDEIYDGITQIDKDGIKVQHSNFNGYTHMAPGGFFVNHNGADVVSLDASGLRVSGSITASSGSIAHYTINEHALVGTNVGLCGSPDYGYWSLWSGSSDSGSAPFRVGHGGELYASRGSISGSMTVDGNCLVNGTITGNKLCIGDYNNYCQLTKGRNLHNAYGSCTWSGVGSHCYWSGSNDYLPFTETGARNPFKQGDTILFDFEAYSGSYRGLTSIGIWFYSDDNSSAYLAEHTTGFDMRADWNRYQVELTLDNEYVKSASTIAILMVISGQYTEVRNVVISRKVGGELIVNGSITADKIAVDAISGKTITGGSISGTYIYGNTIEGGSISGTSISGTTFVSAGTDANSYQYQTMSLNSGSLTMTGAIVGGTNDGQEANRTYVTSMGLIVKDSSYNGFGGNANVFYTNTGIYWNSKAAGGEEWPSWRQLIGYYDDYLLLDNMPLRMTKEIYAQGICTGYTNIYLGPAADGEAKVVALDSAWGVTNAEMNFRPIRASAFYRKDGKHAYINATGGGTTTNESNSLVANGMRTDATDFFLGVDGRVRITNKNGYNNGAGMTYKPIMASAFENGSDLMFKKNIRPTDDLDAIDILNKVDVYRYDMIGGNSNQIGLLAQECPSDLVSGTPYNLDVATANEISDDDRQALIDPDNGGASIDLYHMASILWKVCKEQQKRIENLEDLLKGEDE